MPIIVDRYRGQRVCRIISNGTKPSLVLQDLVNALIGATIKFEVKISDIKISSMDEEEQVNEQEQIDKQEQISDQEQISNQEQIVEREQNVEEKQVNKQERIVEQDQVNKQEQIVEQKQDNRQEQIIELVECKEIIKEREEKERENGKERESEKEEKPRPRLIRGSLTIGSIIKTCCISMDDGADEPVAYIAYDTSELVEIANHLSNLSAEIEELRQVTTVSVGDIVYARSREDNMWYRSLVERVLGEEVSIFFFDWGLRETLSRSRIRYLDHPELGLSKHPACALKLSFTEVSPATREFLKSESEFNLKVEQYDKSKDTYLVTVLY